MPESRGILVFDFQSQGTCEHKSKPGDSVLEEHIIVDFFSQTEIFWRIAPYIINLGNYIEIPFCVIMNLKRQLCAAQRRVPRPTGYWYKFILLYEISPRRIGNSNVDVFHNTNSCETISLTSHDLLKL